ncbi:alpha-glucan family phosphorylase [Candidatus Sulfidibacterium hydrothermale]|uniref:alpha-glucan family phosphorylase n=1 Tax=Candidatus Sulfidibacterium hydrothermale TaxID=2875962 RepID=UPI001F0B423B|nr:alpha-glucan family phosphorylase [Candidatus Sulfidibacterium hydrothermale]UBM62651.1 alpha-glucan family phosphorylase [Candidatus Sulfidibacterium hydrothermale]
MKPDYIFETSWEICNKIGGIYTVLSTKAPVMVENYGDHYLLVGPDVWKETRANPDFIEDKTLFSEWKEKAASQGLQVRTGRWNIPSQPLVILVNFTGLFAKKDEIFARLWETYKLDSLSGQWDYIEPAMFGYAAGQVIESFTHFYLTPQTHVVAHFHEWMTGTGILYLKEKMPRLGTGFTTHATVLGRSIAGNGLPLYEKLETYRPLEMAEKFHIISKNSLETLSAAQADVFTTVSAITSRESRQFLGKQADILTINGMDSGFVPAKSQYKKLRDKARRKAFETASKLTGKNYDENTFLVLTSGRYEFKNKGIDIFIRALGKLNQTLPEGKQILAFITVPAAHDGPQAVFSGENALPQNPYLTHNLLDENNDPVLQEARKNGLNNTGEDRVHLIFVPAYLNENDGVIQLKYYDFLTGFDYTVFPSYYEPWGYTPHESVAFGIPTLTTSYAGFGTWIQEHFDDSRVVTVIDRNGKNEEDIAAEVAEKIILFSENNDTEIIQKETVAITRRLTWKKLEKQYEQAWKIALEKAGKRKEKEQTQWTMPETLRVEASVNPDKPVWKKILVQPVLPKALQPLKELAFNLWWSWNTDAVELFQSILPDQWEALDTNPVMVLESLSLDKINALVNDEKFIDRLHRVYQKFQDYMKSKNTDAQDLIAYFSMEYGLHNSVKIFSGGLGMLAGDYLKQASDSNKNMIAIGLMYRYGYFTQVISHFGDQIAEYHIQKTTQLPLIPVRDKKGDLIRIPIALPGRVVLAKAWRLQVGRVSLFLLDTDTAPNSEEDRKITAQLYGGDNEHRLKQEMILGLGGIRLIEEMGYEPAVYHSNEGHSAFIGLERIRHLIEKEHIPYAVAREVVRANTLFTTHTPVPAGHDSFEEHLMRAYLSHFSDVFSISWEEFMGLGRFNPNDTTEKFSMSVLATRLSQEVNGVSRIHGRVSREMFRPLYPGYYAEELHIGYVTNGVHYFTWTDKIWQELYRNTFDEGFENNQPEPRYWEKIYDISDKKIWDNRLMVKKRMIAFVKEHLHHDMLARQESPRLIIESMKYLNENHLIFGFARRFATYKRAYLLFTNLERLEKIVNHPEKPVLFLFAGKAHPNDKAGQDLIKRIIEVSKMPQFAGRIIFLENYDMIMGKMLTNGVDVWLNTPTRPLEASGTSGEKAIMNGVVNFSVLDGWWAEGYKEGAGWAIPESRTYENQNFQDELDAEMIYNMLEEEIIPTYYAKNADGFSEKWIQHIKNTIAGIAPHFTMQRQLNDYYEKFYTPLLKQKKRFTEQHFSKARELAAWKEKVLQAWDKISVLSLIVPDSVKGPVAYGKHFVAEIKLSAPGLTADDLGIEIIMGNRTNGNIEKIIYKQPLQAKQKENDIICFTCNFPLAHSGIMDYAFRLFPKHELLVHRMDFPLVKWI